MPQSSVASFWYALLLNILYQNFPESSNLLTSQFFIWECACILSSFSCILSAFKGYALILLLSRVGGTLCATRIFSTYQCAIWKRGKVRKLLHSAQNLSFLNCQVFKFIALGFPTPYPHFLLVLFFCCFLLVLGRKIGGALQTLRWLESSPCCFLEDVQQRFLSSLGTGIAALLGKESIFILWIPRIE